MIGEGSSDGVLTLGDRLDALSGRAGIWRLVGLLSLGGCFEFYDLFLTAYLSPALERAGIFHVRGILPGLSDQAAFAAVTFAGLFVGTIAFSHVADRYGRRTIFTGSLLWYSAMTVMMALQNTAAEINFWRFMAGIGIGVELVTIDAYLAELLPRGVRGRAFALNQAIQFTAVPIVALLCALLLNRQPFGVAGWRWVVLIGASGALFIWRLRRSLPESPRWLLQRAAPTKPGQWFGNWSDAVACRPAPGAPFESRSLSVARTGELVEIFRRPLLGITLMLSVFNLFQTVGFYGFGNWVSEADRVRRLECRTKPELLGGHCPCLSGRPTAVPGHRRPLRAQVADRRGGGGTAFAGLLFVRQHDATRLIRAAW